MVAEANRVRLLLRQAFAQHGREVTVYGDHVSDDQGAEFGLWNVAAACHAEPRGEAWPQIVEQHARTVLAYADSRGLDHVTSDQIRSRVYPKLSAAGEVPRQPGLSYLGNQVPGLLEKLVVDFPDAVVTLTDSEITRFGGLTILREAGLANLRSLPPDEVKHVAAADGGTFDVLLGGSSYTASKVLVMPGLLAQTFGEVDARYGMLVALPARDRVAMHVISSRAVIPSMRLMAKFGQASFSDAFGPLSPNVFWWRDGAWAQVTQARLDGTIHFMADLDLSQIIEQFGR
jgi:UPF0716 family protein affecting phage T7 exclusion